MISSYAAKRGTKEQATTSAKNLQSPPIAMARQWMLWLSDKAVLDTRRSWVSRYGTAVAALAVATVARMLFDPIMEDRAPYGFYVLATVFVVWRSGLGPAVMTVCIGAALARYFFESPRGTFYFAGDTNLVSMTFSLLIGLTAALLCESLRVTAMDNARLYQQTLQADSRKDEFLATLAHELRNPLAPIRNALYLIDKLDGNDPQQAELRKTIARQVDHLMHLVNDLLDLSRITRGKIELAVEHVELRSIVAPALDVARPLIEEKRQQFHVALPSGDVHLNGDSVRLTQVLANLLCNAAKYTAAEGRIWLTIESRPDQLIFRVRDTGIGVAPEMQERIFDLFEQADRSIEHTQGGLGIGLTLVRTLVRLHGGTVEVQSPGTGLGSEFTVRLPAAAAPAVKRPMSVPVRQTRHAPLRVLVVEDVAATANSMATILRMWKYTVEVCHDAFAALEAVRAFKPDVVLTDLGLPQMNGYRLAEEIRRLSGTQDVTLIAISGYGQPADQLRSRAAGFACHLVKPIDPAKLEQVLASLALQST